ncbi:BtrH N-terminal domain-containing protein [Paenibacillus amylolyticus]|uniref:BtrH N-terminal domain-containing protein n=1 Tax=Paenibacillus amylolyticus TaxID=1451 RepID=UPI003EC154C3
MNSVILPMYEPKLNTYNVYATLFSIIAKDESYLPWYYSNFIALGINTCDDTLYFTDHFTFFEYGEGLTSCPWLEVYKPSHKTIYYDYKFDIQKVLTSYLDQNKYIWLHLDQFYIPLSVHYQKMHKEHSLLVYGYDDATNVFYIADSLDNGKFTKTTLSYQQLKKAWESEICEHFRRLFRVISRKPGEYTLNTEHLKIQIEDYLSSKSVNKGIYWDQIPVDGPHSYVQNKKFWIFGIEVYKYILNLNKQLKESSGHKSLDLRIPHLLWQHKKCMLERIHYLNLANTDIYNDYKKIVDESLLILNLSMKYNMTTSESILERIDTKINKVVFSEKITLRKLLELL